MQTGKVIDVEPMSRYCKQCAIHEKKRKTDQKAYDSWKAEHKYPVNYKGSAPNMEVEGMKWIFLRSVENYSLRYTELPGDGDCKTFPAVENMYSPIKVIKKVCR